MESEKIIKKGTLSKEELERLEILQNAEEIKGEQLSLSLNSELVVENEAKKLIGQRIDNPVEKFQLYYKGLNKLLRDFLPKGKKNEEARRIIYDEKNILINRGAKKDENGIRGSDGRMAYLEDLEHAILIVADWVTTKGSYYDLYKAFWNKNEELGYGHQG
jgi:hypothetical protein